MTPFTITADSETVIHHRLEDCKVLPPGTLEKLLGGIPGLAYEDFDARMCFYIRVDDAADDLAPNLMGSLCLGAHGMKQEHFIRGPLVVLPMPDHLQSG